MDARETAGSSKVVRIGGASGFWGDSSWGRATGARAASTTWCSTTWPN